MTLSSLPAMVALLVKLLLFFYAARSHVKSYDSKIYLLLLACLGAHNLTEVAILTFFPIQGLTSRVSAYGYAYFATFIIFIALLLHLTLRVGVDKLRRSKSLAFLYLPTWALIYLLLFTDFLVKGFVPFGVQTIIRDPGFLYALFEIYVVVYLLASLVSLGYGMQAAGRSTLARARTRWWLVALLPMAVLMMYIIVGRNFGWTSISSTIYVPIAQTWFLIVGLYVTFQYRLFASPYTQCRHRFFEIEFYIPWSKVGKKKRQLYTNIRRLANELSELMDVQKAVTLLGDFFRCPVALVGTMKPVLATQAAHILAAVPEETLNNIDSITSTNEIKEINPKLYGLLRRHNIDAVIPFFPHYRSTRGWFLLGDKFNEQVYARSDFFEIEGLLEKLADLFLGTLVSESSALKNVYAEVCDLKLSMKNQAQRINVIQKREQINQRALKLRDELLVKLHGSIDSEEWRVKSLEECVVDYEMYIIQKAIEHCRGNNAQAAKLLGLKSNTLHYKLKRYKKL